jgi:arylsulfatase A-like enzyme
LALQRRRTFLRHSAVGVAGAFLSRGAAAGIEGPASPPNIIMITCDQMRGDAMGCMGNPNARTPHLDALAAGGVLFKNWFVNNPVCVPSRMSVFSGLHPAQHGRLANVGESFLPGLEGTLLGYLRGRDYRLGWVGKDHTYEKGVLKRELDYVRIRSREPFRKYSAYVPPWWHSDFFGPEETSHGRLNTKESVDFLQGETGEVPFFLHVSYFDPHPPYMAPATYSSRYASRDMKLPDYVTPERLSGRLALHQRALRYDRVSDGDLTETLRYYHASVEYGVDAQVGELMAALKASPHADNTIVIFTADHGDFMGHHRMVRKGMFLYDALLHVPMIWYGPKYFAGGLTTDSLGQGVDIFPTLADLCGGGGPDMLAGRSVLDVLRGVDDGEEERAVYASAAYSDLPAGYFDDPEPRYDLESGKPFHSRVQDHTWQPEQRTVMVRTKAWKLILNESQPAELYHMADGRVEQENVAGRAEHADIQKNLEEKARAHWQW